MAEILLDVRRIEPRDRHPRIFMTFDELPVGGSLVLANDHDPRPLYYQFHAERQGAFTWDYLEAGPDLWQVRITKSAEFARDQGACCGHCGG
jgi:uncharacterized protein (DUF2249 family)